MVYDSGNYELRLIDMNQRMVTTLAGNGKNGRADGKALAAEVGGLWGMVYVPSEDSVYFTQPEYGTLRKLDLVRSEISTVLANNPHIPRPKAVCFFKDQLCLCGEGPKQMIFRLKTFGYPARPPEFSESVGIGNDVLAMSSLDGKLYACQAGRDRPLVRIDPAPKGNITNVLASVWGHPIQEHPEGEEALWTCSRKDDQVGLIPDPVHQRLIAASQNLECVVSVKDHSFNDLIRGGTGNSQGLYEFEVPYVKPPHTFRILLVGSSYIFYQTGWDEVRWGGKKDGGFGNRMESMPKRLELMLNSEASLDSVPWHFEVLNLGRTSQASYLQLCNEAPRIIEKYDVDLVLFCVFSSTGDIWQGSDLYFQHPLTKEGIPQAGRNTEYMLQNWDRKIPDGVAREFYEACRLKHWVRTINGNKIQLVFAPCDELVQDPSVRRSMEALWVKPILVFQEELDQEVSKLGHKVDFRMALTPVGDTGPMEGAGAFWRDVAIKTSTPMLDLSDNFLALSRTYWPLDEWAFGRHLTANGHFLFAYLLTHELITHKWVPFNPVKETILKK